MNNLKRFLSALLLMPAFLFAQVPNMDHYQTAKSNGPLPNDFLISTTKKYELDKQKIDSSGDKKMQKAEDAFYLQTNYSLDQMRFGGQVLVNDTMGIYVNRVADSLLLKQDPDLRHHVKFYVIRAEEVNAFTTDQGAIFVTMGLLTRLSNEAELAYVLAHEVIHYKRHHVLIGYKESVKAQEGLGQYEQTTFENRFLKRHRYARSQESQADEEGFDLLVNSNYDPHAAIAAFDILALADFPFADTLFQKSFFETNYLRFPSKYIEDTVKAIKMQDEDEDDDLATHPSVYKRRKAIMHKFAKLSGADTTGKLFLNSQDMFWRVKAMARFEEITEHIANGEFSEAIYSDYAEQKIYPDNPYLKKEMVRCMYASVIKKNRAFGDGDLAELLAAIFSGVYGDDDKPVGEQGRLKEFVSQTDAAGWNVAALKYAWQVHLEYPDDKDVTEWCAGLFRELAMKNDVRLKDFQGSDSTFIAVGNKVLEDTALARKVKGNFPAARFQAAIDHLDRDSLSNYNYWQFAFIDELKDSSFVQMFRAADLYADSIDLDDSLWYEKSRRERKDIKAQNHEEYYGTQGLTKVVAVNPVYIAYDDRDENSDINVLASLNGRDQLINEMKLSAGKCNLDLTFLDENYLDTGSADRFNDLSVASQWFNQRQDYGDNQILPFPQEEMKAMAAKYGTKYFMWSAYLTYTSKRGGTAWRILSLAALPLAPHILYHLFTPQQDVYYVAIIYDVTTGKPVFAQRTEMTNQRPTDARIRMHVFDLMRQLTLPKKNKN